MIRCGVVANRKLATANRPTAAAAEAHDSAALQEHASIDTFKTQLQLDEQSVSTQAIPCGHTIRGEFAWIYKDLGK